MRLFSCFPTASAVNIKQFCKQSRHELSLQASPPSHRHFGKIALLMADMDLTTNSQTLILLNCGRGAPAGAPWIPLAKWRSFTNLYQNEGRHETLLGTINTVQVGTFNRLVHERNGVFVGATLQCHSRRLGRLLEARSKDFGRSSIFIAWICALICIYVEV